jgi:epoxyqueuosine reductase QueG
MDAKKLAEAAKAAGADVFGVANVGRFDELPVRQHPRTIFPETKSVIVLGRRIPRGALRGVEEGTNFANYSLYGRDWLDNRITSLTTIRVSEWIEDHGWEAVPLPNLPPEVPPMGVSVRPGSPEPNVLLDVDDAAVRAGVGEIGYVGVLLTPEFGPRQRLQMILTDAEIEPTPLLKETIWPAGNTCEGFCPLGAIGKATERTICGKTMTVAAIDYGRCAKCKNGAGGNPHHRAGKPDRLAAVCVRSTIDLLEREERIGNTFAIAFRQREPWTVKSDVDLFRV